MKDLKESLRSWLGLQLVVLLAFLGLEQQAMDVNFKAIADLHSFVFANVPGFRRPVFMFGKKVLTTPAHSHTHQHQDPNNMLELHSVLHIHIR